jgi:nitrate/nitrite transport system substrate-binding protein
MRLQPVRTLQMSRQPDPYDADRPLMLRCACGAHGSSAEHDAAAAADAQAHSNALIEASLVKALFPRDDVRRRFLKAVGRRSAMAAIGSVLPVAALQAMAQDKGGLEKRISRSASSRSPAPRR